MGSPLLLLGLAAAGLLLASQASARIPADLPARIAAAAREAGVEPRLLAAIAEVESSTGRNPAGRGIHPDGVSVGILGVTPGAAETALGRPVRATELRDVGLNLRAGARYLARQLARYGGDTAAAVRAYHMGTDPHDPAYPAARRTAARAEGDRYWRAVSRHL